MKNRNIFDFILILMKTHHLENKTIQKEAERGYRYHDLFQVILYIFNIPSFLFVLLATAIICAKDKSLAINIKKN